MKCPTCPDQTLTMTERSGVEIDYCPSCRGVWLDRGELDKIIDRSGPASTSPTRDERTPESGRDGKPKKRKRESFLSDLFEF